MSEPKAWTVARSIVWASAMLLAIGSFVTTVWLLVLGRLPAAQGISLLVLWLVVIFFTALTRYRAPQRKENE